MAFIGNTNTTQAFTPAIDYFSGNASTTAFTLSRPVASVAQVQAVVNNVAQNPSDAFTVSGNTITFTSAPSSGTNNIYVYYTSPITQVIAPSQGTVGTTQLQNGLTVNFADGTAAAPSITNDGDTNTGIFFPAADTVGVSTGGSERMRIDTSGYILGGYSSVFDTSPAGTGQYAGISSSTSAGNWKFGAWSFSADSTANGMLFVKSRSATVGTNTVVQSGDALGNIAWRGADGTNYINAASIQAFVDGTPGTNDMPGRLVFTTTADGASTTTERMRIDSSGNLLVGTTTSSGSGNLIAAGVYNNTTASGANVQVDNTGPGLLRRSTSSIVYKTDVEPIAPEYINNALKFRPVWYRSLCEGDRKDWSWYGLIAEEVGAVDPRLVHWRSLDTTVDANGNTVQTPLEKPVAEGVMYDRVVVLALGLIQEQQALITALTARIEALENK